MSLRRITDIESQRPKLSSLQIFSPNELKELKDTYDLPEQKLEEAANRHPWMGKFYKVGFFSGRWINVLYIPFTFAKSNASIQPIADFLRLGVTVSTPVAYAIGGTVSIVSTLYWVKAFNDEKAVVKARINYALQDPINVRALRLCEQPGHTLLIGVDNGMLFIMNLTTMNTLFISMPGFQSFHIAAKLGIFAVVQFSGHFFYEGYSNKQYKKDSIKFWFAKNKAWILGQLKRGDVITFLQAFFAFLGVVGLRAFPLIPNIAMSSAEALGWWFHPYMLMPMAVILYSRVLYPSTYETLLGPQNRARELLTRQLNHDTFLNEASRDLKEVRINDTNQVVKYADARLSERVDAKMKLWEAKIEKEQKWFYPIRHQPSMLGEISIRSFAGGITGHLLLASTLSYGGPILGACIMAGISYQGKKKIVRDILICQSQQQAEQKSEEKEKEKDCRDKCGDATRLVAAHTVNTSNGVATTMTNVGAGVEVLGVSSPWATFAIIWMALESGVNMIAYGLSGALDSLSGTCRRKKQVTHTPSMLFHHPEIKKSEGKLCAELSGYSATRPSQQRSTIA